MCSFNTPLHFTKAELEELRGTNLANASSTVYRNLQEQWDRLGPAMITAAKHAGLEKAPTFDDLLWAFSVYWSRGLSLPIPEEGAGDTPTSFWQHSALQLSAPVGLSQAPHLGLRALHIQQEGMYTWCRSGGISCGALESFDMMMLMMLMMQRV